MLKKKIEAILFASGRKVDLEELSRLCKTNNDEIMNAINELKKKYDEHSPLLLIEEGNAWKLNVKEDFLPLVQKIVQETELSKTMIETLATVAYKVPVKQSDIIKIRTNKAYDHLDELEKAGYISREKYGRTKLIKLTQKFYGYFDLPPEKVKEKFKKLEQLEKEIGDIEKVAEFKKEEFRKKEGELRKRREEEDKQRAMLEKGIDLEEEDLKQIQKKE